MTATSRIAPIKAKVERAKEHVENLEIEIKSRQPYLIVPDDEPQTGDRVFRIAGASNESLAPNRWAVIIGEVVHNLRSSLDHLAWQLVDANGGQPSRQTTFPIFSSSNKSESEAEHRDFNAC